MSTPENGILLCHQCHALAHIGYITPSELLSWKQGMSRLIAAPIGPESIEDIIEATRPYEKDPGIPPQQLLSFSQAALTRMRSIKDPPDSIVPEIRRTIGRLQLRMAGALTSSLRSAYVPKRMSERYFIDALARSATRIGSGLKDRFLELQGRHSLATNANARLDFPAAMRHADAARRLFDWCTQSEPGYAAYLARNLSVIYAKGGRHQLAEDLLDKSERIAGCEAELHVRMAEVLMLKGEMRDAGRVLDDREKVVTSIQSMVPNERTIAARVHAGHLCLTGQIREGMELLDTAIQTADENGLGHQLSKTTLGMSVMSSKSHRARIPTCRNGRIRGRLQKRVIVAFF